MARRADREGVPSWLLMAGLAGRPGTPTGMLAGRPGAPGGMRRRRRRADALTRWARALTTRSREPRPPRAAGPPAHGEAGRG
ncbi:hypothetical protein ACFSKW_51230 [Nonomuraea mangrovi]|uniref:Uncharacterized protein n=1 Tax=Nonomuraea mangrovi TaxID=2316207 RepID=A0ABW4TCY3_9ACTN